MSRVRCLLGIHRREHLFSDTRLTWTWVCLDCGATS